MLKPSLIFSLSLLIHTQCGGGKIQPADQSSRLPQPEHQASPPSEKRGCDLSSYNALRVHSLPSERKAQPVYPPVAKGQKVSGRVLVKVIVDKRGNVVRACAVEGDERLRRASEGAALESKFREGFWNGDMAERYDYVEFVISYNFVR